MDAEAAVKVRPAEEDLKVVGTLRIPWILWWPLCCLSVTQAAERLHRADEKAALRLPDFGAEVRSFEASRSRPSHTSPCG
jgi:hypothetical protein